MARSKQIEQIFQNFQWVKVARNQPAEDSSFRGDLRCTNQNISSVGAQNVSSAPQVQHKFRSSVLNVINLIRVYLLCPLTLCTKRCQKVPSRLRCSTIPTLNINSYSQMQTFYINLMILLRCDLAIFCRLGSKLPLHLYN